MSKLSVRHSIVVSFAAVAAVMLGAVAVSFMELSEAARATQMLRERALGDLAASERIDDALSLDFALRATDAEAAQRTGAALDAAVGAYGAGSADAAGVVSAVQAYDAARDLAPRTRESEAALQAAFERAHEAIQAAEDANAAAAVRYAERIDAAIGVVLSWCAIAFAIALLLCVASAVVLNNAIGKPLQLLVRAMDAMRQGDFSKRVDIERSDEFGTLSYGFNRMADEITSLVSQVQRSGIQVSTSMTEIAATTKQQQATAAEVAATTTEVGATSMEISATSKELLKTINEVAVVAERTAGLATSGQSDLSGMESTMRGVADAAGAINAKLGVLNEKAGNINQVVTMIGKVADQTNLLSLNAAIEAEKAGEYGRGFAVVASEIRRLADQTAVATYDIEQMVKEIQSAISASVMGMDKFSEEVRRGLGDVRDVSGRLSEIIRQVQALVPLFEVVKEGMEGQSLGAEQICEALQQLTSAAQETVESLRQSTESLDELNGASGALRTSVARFKLSA